MVASSEKFVRLIMRRPHALWFKEKYPKAPIPGFVFLSPDGDLIDLFALGLMDKPVEQFRSLIEVLAKSAARNLK